MLSDGESLLSAICEQPWENTPRLIYADWLEENGRPERAEFIRLQIELEGVPPNERCTTPQYDRAEALLLEWGEPPAHRHRTAVQPELAWSAELPTGAGLAWRGLYARGFQIAVTFDSMEAVREHAEAVMAASPVEDVAVMRVQGRAEVGELLALPWVARLTALHLSGSVGALGLELIARCGVLGRLEHLDLSKSQTADAGLRALASSTDFPNLKRLNLDGNARGVTQLGLNALLNTLALDRLTAVDGVRHALSSWLNAHRIYDEFYERFPDSR